MNFILRACVVCAVFGITASSGVARADECGDLAGQLSASRAGIDAAVGDPAKPANDLADMASQNEALSRKLAMKCRGSYDDEAQRAWERQLEAKKGAADTCRQLRTAVPNGAAKDIEKTGAQSSLAEVQRMSLVSSAGQCIQRLSVFGSALNPHLTACLAECRQKQQQYSKARTPECTSGVQKASAVLDQMQTFLDSAAAGHQSDVMIDFNVIRERYARESVEAAQKCEHGTLPDLESRFALMNVKAAALDNYNQAKGAVAKKLNATMIATYSSSCVSTMSRIPARDARLEALLVECKGWNAQARAPSTPSNQAKSTSGGGGSGQKKKK